MILLVSEDSIFAQTAAQMIHAELDIACDITNQLQKSPKPAAEYALVLADSNTPQAQIVISKPCYMPDLLAAVVQHLRPQVVPAKTQLGEGYALDLQAKQITATQTSAAVDVTDKEMALLQRLQAAGKQGMDRQALLEAVWGMDDETNTKTLESHVYRLREKLKQFSAPRLGIELSESKYKLVI